jgi:hypothetical protein
MSDIRLGVLVSQVDASTAQQFPVGTELDDPRGGIFAGNRIKYIRANGSIATNDAVHTDVSYATAAERHATVVSTSAVSQMVEGVNDLNAGMTSGQFGWITVKGRATCKTTGITAATNAKLGTTGTGGTLGALTAATPSNAEVIAAIAAAAGKGVKALSDTNTPATGLSYVLLS